MSVQPTCPFCNAPTLQAGSWGLSNLPTCPICGAPDLRGRIPRETPTLRIFDRDGKQICTEKDFASSQDPTTL